METVTLMTESGLRKYEKLNIHTVFNKLDLECDLCGKKYSEHSCNFDLVILICPKD